MAGGTFTDYLIELVCCHRCRKRHNSQVTSTTTPAAPNQSATILRTINPAHVGSSEVDRPRSDVSRDSGVAVDMTDSFSVPGPVKTGSVVVAIYTFNPTCQGDLRFKKGDKMRVLDASDSGWWKAVHLETKKQGCIPSNYVAPTETVECEEWYHGDLLRKEADSLLQKSGTGTGTFLIRKSERLTGNYALSLLRWDMALKINTVKHYVIIVVSGKHYIKEGVSFDSLQELVKFYIDDAAGLDTRLITPCLKAQPHLYDLSSETKDNWEVTREMFKKEKLLGEGNHGQVWLGRYLADTTTKVAIKTFKPGMMSPDAFMQEAAIMKTLRHKNLVSLYAVCSKDEPIWIITEYMPYGSLLNFLKSPGGNQLQLVTLLEMATQVAFGMCYLESRQLIHRDLAARNILVGDNNLVKISDFGLARIINDDVYEPSSQYALPIKWTAPEVYLYNRCTVKSDVWSFGILLMEIVTYGATPYKDLTNTEVYHRIPLGYRMPRPKQDSCPEVLYDLMKQCWEKEPKERPNFEYLYSFLNDYTVNKTQYD